MGLGAFWKEKLDHPDRALSLQDLSYVPCHVCHIFYAAGSRLVVEKFSQFADNSRAVKGLRTSSEAHRLMSAQSDDLGPAATPLFFRPGPRLGVESRC